MLPRPVAVPAEVKALVSAPVVGAQVHVAPPRPCLARRWEGWERLSFETLEGGAREVVACAELCVLAVPEERGEAVLAVVVEVSVPLVVQRLEALLGLIVLGGREAVEHVRDLCCARRHPPQLRRRRLVVVAGKVDNVAKHVLKVDVVLLCAPHRELEAEGHTALDLVECELRLPIPQNLVIGALLSIALAHGPQRHRVVDRRPHHPEAAIREGLIVRHILQPPVF
mmetsp:Transcript_47713/g.97520  ORF Transcript_47713/g.97520 Transcript_47713/m.97520 type:complete len:226 (-) Transcript_47713:963-1640(-)